MKPLHLFVTTSIDRLRRHRRGVAAAAYSLTTALALTAAFLARFEFNPAMLATDTFVVALVLLIPIRLAVNYFMRLGISRWRYVGLHDLPRLLAAMTAGSIAFYAVAWGLPIGPRTPRSIILLEWVFSGYLIGGIWALYRMAYEFLRVRQASSRTRVLVVGAGEAGQELVKQMLRSNSGLVPVALVDDDPFRWGTLVHGIEVTGAIRDAANIATDVDAEEILIAIPSATPTQLRNVIQACESAELPLKILPGIESVLTGEANLGHVRKVEVEDLLGRDTVRLELPELRQELSGKVVLVTGAAGSIGSELVRQVAANAPRHLVLLDQAETPMYFLELELRREHPALPITAVVGSVTDEDTVEMVCNTYRPDRIFHAAAYKHVPLMQENPREAMRTNVLGTFLLARAAAASGVATFLLISTDKAVRPSSVMGASKQLAERVCLYLQRQNPEVEFRAVRFGNVLGSNGSVIPLFRRQIERGQPLTVTHEDVTRYFMTIPEAVQLVLRTSTLEESRGRVAMLEMGEPMRILDLARNLLRLSGRPFRLGENVVISGLRPGEKLHEELAAPDERVAETAVPGVNIVETAPDFGALPFDIVRALEQGEVGLLVDHLFALFPKLDRRSVVRMGIRA